MYGERKEGTEEREGKEGRGKERGNKGWGRCKRKRTNVKHV
jgi:hypothetical protein